MTCFHAPKAHILHIGIEYLYPTNMAYCREFCDSVSIVFFTFLDQVHDFTEWYHNMVWWIKFWRHCTHGHPFSNDQTRNDGFVDEIHDAHWYHLTNDKCKCISGNEPDLILPVIGYIDKTGTDVNQRNTLEPFSFTLSILNQWYRYCSNAWRVLGFMPYLKHNLPQQITHGRSGPTLVRKEWHVIIIDVTGRLV